MYSAMIVDDLSIFRRQIHKLPVWGEQSGFEICAEAQDGHRALELLREQPVDLLITDIRMPVMDGLGLLKAVHDEKLATFVVFLTDYDEFALAKEAIAHGIFDYLLKPVEETAICDVLGRVSEALDEERARAEELETLRSKLDEKLSLYFPEAELTELVGSIGTTHTDYRMIANHMLESTKSALDGDPVKYRRVVSRIFTELRDRLLEEKPWLILLIDGEELHLAKEKNPIDQEEILDALDNLAKYLERIDPWGNGHPLVEQIKGYVLEGEDGGISQDDLTDLIHLSKKHIAETFRRETGITLGDYLTTVKMYRAGRLLADQSLKIYQIAERLGYSDEYFTKLFKRTFGKTPLQHRTETTVK